ALVFSLPRRTRQWLTMALAIGFGVKLAVFPEVSGDLTHLLGFGLGMLVMGQGIVRGRTQSTESSD
ncbi:MAG: hypothetical protein KDB53_02115, partial [Planctomycetes bacterium]|nr:hypothetical protein [Planctomycetota bacterium]